MYAQCLKLDDEEKEEFHFFIRRLDIAQIESIEAKKKAEKPPKMRSV